MLCASKPRTVIQNETNSMKLLAIILFSVISLTSSGQATKEKEFRYAFYHIDTLGVYFEPYKAIYEDINRLQMENATDILDKSSEIRAQKVELNEKLRANLLSQNGREYLTRKIAGLENDLFLLEQEYMVLEEEIGLKIENLNTEIERLAKDFCLEKDISLLIRYEKGSNISFIDPILDVSKEFTLFLNENYSD